MSRPAMKLFVNGEARQVPAPLSLCELMQFLGLKEDRVAVEVNREIVRRDRWADTELQPDDHLEIVQFVGGG